MGEEADAWQRAQIRAIKMHQIGHLRWHQTVGLQRPQQQVLLHHSG